MRVRDAIRDLGASRIAEISALGMGDPDVIPLWYGEGDLPTPDFVGAAATSIMGGEPRLVSLDPAPAGGGRLEPERLFAARDRRTRGIFVNSPSNPTGWVISAAEIATLLDFARRCGLWLISDEVYNRIT